MHFVRFLIYLTVLVGPDSYSYRTTCMQSECSGPGLYAGALSQGSGYSYIVGIP